MRGIEDEIILVVRSTSAGVVERIIQSLLAVRDKELKEIGQQLESEWNDKEGLSERISKPGPENKGPRRGSGRPRAKKTTNSKYGAK